MQVKLGLKMAIIAMLVVMLQIGLWSIHDQVRQRQRLQQEVIAEIADSAAAEQTLIGPLLLLEYPERVQEASQDGQPPREHTVLRRQVFSLDALTIDGSVSVETRQRSIYRTNLFRATLALQGTMALPARLGLDDAQARQAQLDKARAFVLLGVSDLRGIGNSPTLQVNGRSLAFQTGHRGALESPAIHAELGPVDLNRAQEFTLQLPLELLGSQRLAIAPTADLTQVALQSAWPHPSFQGRFLPARRDIGADGFSAQWQVSHLARDFGQTLRAGLSRSHNETLEVQFANPVNIYSLSERAMKYGILFIVLSFAAFFLIETLQRRAIHPMQYLLVGLALAIFFLLLLALSERIAFGAAYAISAAACVLLIGSYLGAMLGNRGQGFGLAGGIASLYGILYGILLSEDNALLMGSLLLFGALTALMLGTRHIDWYALGAARPAAKESRHEQ
ncbi:cell envelope integrity protein CreD [Corticibacter populi]|uniref:Cell envelope integrity protein CreD n=1 Tax=Corticibacter populi TaxID=1550736 RepID=A0A3M6QIQ8_9BURK|nr:cell envelope integrity protein CreD [Corticibacter populi]RMX02611.1 cell envelope integrity protein CreD [Corticibacter populi]RZS32974.1 inner membrane protein [Corticibacter populi]